MVVLMVMVMVGHDHDVRHPVAQVAMAVDDRQVQHPHLMMIDRPQHLLLLHVQHVLHDVHYKTRTYTISLFPFSYQCLPTSPHTSPCQHRHTKQSIDWKRLLLIIHQPLLSLSVRSFHSFIISLSVVVHQLCIYTM
jgi:hypothetical protein